MRKQKVDVISDVYKMNVIGNTGDWMHFIYNLISIQDDAQNKHLVQVKIFVFITFVKGFYILNHCINGGTDIQMRNMLFCQM